MKRLIFLGAAIGFISMASCSKMDAHYGDFIKDGAKIYTGKADSLTAAGGKGRVILSWILFSDQNITGCRVLWNFGADSLIIPVKRSLHPDTIKLPIELAEGAYNFTVYTFDSKGNGSVGAEVIANSYGAAFQSSILPRTLRSADKQAAAGTISITWVGREEKCIGTEWQFTGKDNLPKTHFSPLGDTTMLSGCDVSKPVSYRSVYLPEKNAVDTFYTGYKPL
ncbi:DUF4998 domain-containing protein [uncultured Chitinophaga sp.]|uniref:DUF4998 domain-containing protein n=1 Tax=uncultured Chitinophaga sp. TaxID=339340 RepID=UPI0025D84D8C|nr:DUF4998 domain-containing protein [uncultured Chitinophaga sp.]